MIKFLFFLLFIPQVLAFAVTPTILDFNKEKLENTFIIFNTDEIPKEYSISSDKALGVDKQIINVEPKGRQIVTVRLDQEEYVNKDPIIYIKEISEGNINKILGIKTTIDLETRELFEIRNRGQIPTEINLEKNYEKIISIIVGILIIGLVLIKGIRKYKNGGENSEIKLSS